MKKTAAQIHKEGYQINRNMFTGRMTTTAQQYARQLQHAMMEELQEEGTCSLLEDFDTELESAILSGKQSVGVEQVLYEVLYSVMAAYHLDKTPVDFSTIDYLKQSNITWAQCRRQPVLVSAESLAQGIKEILEIAKQHKNEEKAEQKVLEQQAKQSAGQLIADAEKERDEIIAQAYKERETILEQARLEAQQNAKELFSKYVSEGQRRISEQARETIRQEAMERAQSEELMRTTYMEMGNRIDSLQVAYIRQLDALKQQIDIEKNGLYQALHDWQVSLSPKRDRPLAEKYIELYRLLRIDRILSKEIIYQSEHGAGGETVESLRKLEETLNTFLARFERALGSLDLYVYRPEAGSYFNEYDMISDVDDPYNRRVKSVLVPGIKKHSGETEYDDETIVTSEVVLEEA